VKELVWIFPIIAAISLVLGTCRARNLRPILKESGLSFGRILGAIVLIVIVLQVVLWFIPRVV
jgi:hypothetical protein